jgi:hypothetical protein
MRRLAAIAIAVVALAGCDHSPTVATSGLLGPWTAVLRSFPDSGTVIFPTIADSAGTVQGTASWVDPYSIRGNYVDSTVTFTANSTRGAPVSWSFTGIVAGGTMLGRSARELPPFPPRSGRGPSSLHNLAVTIMSLEMRH